uniref:Uncharacterized protein n=1 Tax=Arundo donax TaxID=35708 RepID=A0A0A9FMV0_ARUDO
MMHLLGMCFYAIFAHVVLVRLYPSMIGLVICSRILCSCY